MKTHRSWAWAGLAALTLASCAAQINQLKARQAFKDANVAYAAKNYGKAIQDYGRAIELDPDGKAGVLLHSTFYLGSSHHLLYRPGKEDEDNRKHLDEAMRYYEKTLTIDSKYRYAIEQLAGIYRDHLDDFENAEKYFMMIIEMEPNRPENWYSLGALYERFHDPDTQPLLDKAIAAYQKPVEMTPNDPAAYRQVAGLLNKYARFDETMEWLAKARDVDTSNPEGYYTMATYYWDKVFRDPGLKLPEQKEYVKLGMEQVDKAVELGPAYLEKGKAGTPDDLKKAYEIYGGSLIYKGLLLREEAKREPNKKKSEAILAEAKTFQEQAMALKKEQDAAAAAAKAAAQGAAGQAPSHD